MTIGRNKTSLEQKKKKSKTVRETSEHERRRGKDEKKVSADNYDINLNSVHFTLIFF